MARIMQHMSAGLPKLPPPTLSALMLLCALVVIDLALAGALQQMRGTGAPVAIVAK
jgi:hypothetical protein